MLGCVVRFSSNLMHCLIFVRSLLLDHLTLQGGCHYIWNFMFSCLLFLIHFMELFLNELMIWLRCVRRHVKCAKQGRRGLRTTGLWFLWPVLPTLYPNIVSSCPLFSSSPILSHNIDKIDFDKWSTTDYNITFLCPNLFYTKLQFFSFGLYYVLFNECNTPSFITTVALSLRILS